MISEDADGEQILLDILESIPPLLQLKSLSITSNKIRIEKLSQFPLLEKCTLFSEDIEFPSTSTRFSTPRMPSLLELHLESIPEEHIMTLPLIFPNLQKLSFDDGFVNEFGDVLLTMFSHLHDLKFVNTNNSDCIEDFEALYPDIEFI